MLPLALSCSGGSSPGTQAGGAGTATQSRGGGVGQSSTPSSDAQATAGASGGGTQSQSTLSSGGGTRASAGAATGGSTGGALGGASSTGGRSNPASSVGTTAGSGGSASGGRTVQGGSTAVAGTTAPGGAGGTSSGGASPSGPVQMIDATHVRLLTGSPFYDRQELHRKGYLAQLQVDKLLYPYRATAKLAQPSGVTGGYAGWDTGFIAGHLSGHYLSAASRMAAATGDTSFTSKVNTMVAELAKCQTALGTGYLAAFPATALDWLEGKGSSVNGIVVPYYTIQKIMSGLLDAYHYLGNQQALEVASKMGDFVQARLAGLSASTIETIFRTDGSKNPQNEFGAMSDALAELSVATGQTKYLETAKLFNRSWFMTPLASGQDKLQNLHGNTHISAALGIAHTANLSGDSTSLQASENFWKLLTGPHAFVHGGNAFKEWLDKAGIEAGPSVDGTLPATTAETCNSNNMLKLTTWLTRRGPRMDYADYYERTLYNHILASIAPDTGQMTYFTPLHGHFRTYMDGTYCCTGTGIENPPRYNEGIYYEQGSTLWVNMYFPNEVTWEKGGMTIRQEGNAAEGEPVKISIVKAGDATQATFNLRIPFWVSGKPEVTINGAAAEQTASPGKYLALSRPWKTGDVVTLTLPTGLRIERAKDVNSMVSIFYGPVLLAGQLGTSNMPSDFADKDKYLSTAPVTVPAISSSSANPADWLEQMDGSALAFKARNVGAADGIVFAPLYQTHHQRYSVYWTLQAAP
jgi:DUF1680 family protein